MNSFMKMHDSIIKKSPVVRYLQVLVLGADGAKQILDLPLVLQGLASTVRQQLLEQLLLQGQTALQLLHNLAWACTHLG